MKCLFQLFFFFLINTVSLSALSDEVLEFSFERTFDCKKHFISHVRCAITNPKPFTQQEKELVLSTLEKLSVLTHIMIPQIMKEHSKIHFFRHEKGYGFAKNFNFKASPTTLAWVKERNRYEVHLTDRFFNIKRSINENYSFQDYVLVHELAHLFDLSLKRPSEKKEFLNLYGWQEVETGEVNHFRGVPLPLTRWQTQNISYKEVDLTVEKINALIKEKNYDQAKNLSLSFGQSHGHPTTYSLTNPQENFAELIANCLLAPETCQTLPPAAEQWLEKLLFETPQSHLTQVDKKQQSTKVFDKPPSNEIFLPATQKPLLDKNTHESHQKCNANFEKLLDEDTKTSEHLKHHKNE